MGDEKIKKVEAKFWPKVKKVAGRVPFIEDAAAMYHSMLDPKTPLSVKLSIAGALLYFIAPIDVIPDVLMPFGYLDDAGFIAGVLKSVVSHVTDEHRRKAKESLGKI